MKLLLRFDVISEAARSACPSLDRRLVECHYVATTRALAVLQFDR